MNLPQPTQPGSTADAYIIWHQTHQKQARKYRGPSRMENLNEQGRCFRSNRICSEHIARELLDRGFEVSGVARSEPDSLDPRIAMAPARVARTTTLEPIGVTTEKELVKPLTIKSLSRRIGSARRASGLVASVSPSATVRPTDKGSCTHSHTELNEDVLQRSPALTYTGGSIVNEDEPWSLGQGRLRVVER